ncbi:hypothetical protein [Phenylobacterium sp.]|uniref:hypothetical protein n=1 Tax=Phenylobacterium sp. TaxID=1871053 RepID=UPI002FCAC6E4
MCTCPARMREVTRPRPSYGSSAPAPETAAPTRLRSTEISDMVTKVQIALVVRG